MTDWIEQESRYLFQNYGRQPIVIERGEGTRVWDTEGKDYLDFVGGLAVTALGHNHPAVTSAISEQAQQLLHVSNLYYTTPMVELAKMLVEHSCLDRVFFCNSGAEANETAIKLARRWGHDEREGAHEIISTENGFHGRTFGSLAATGTARYREPFEPLPAGFTHVPWDDVDAIKAATTDQTVAVMLEPIQAEGGVVMPSPGYLRAVREWCDERGLLLILDEVQAGMGRTGKLWAYEHEGIEPDIMTVAKAIANGLPLGAVLAREEIAKHLVPGDHGTTFGAGPLVCSAGVATLRTILDDGLLEHAARQSDRIVSRIRALEDQLSLVTDVRGRGLLLAVGLSSEVAPEAMKRCRERGLLVNNVRPNALRLMPPLNVSDEEADAACDILEAVLRELDGEVGTAK